MTGVEWLALVKLIAYAVGIFYSGAIVEVETGSLTRSINYEINKTKETRVCKEYYPKIITEL